MDNLILKKKFPFNLLLPLILMTMILFSQTGKASTEGGFTSAQADFAVKFKDVVSSYRVLSVFALPGESLTLEVEDGVEKREFQLDAEAGRSTQTAPKTWIWHAPKKTGLYPLEISSPQSSQAITLNVFVQVPYSRLKNGYLNGYRIGKYPRIPFKLLPNYDHPGGFIEVTSDNEETQVSPHFKLKQFLCKQKGGYPKYVVLKEKLLLKLETILEKVNEKGYRCNTFHVMSGYRTPYYNRSLGNVKYSCHQWGSAADIFIDEDEDGMMDDLDHDGRVNRREAEELHDLINEIYREPVYASFLGGLGIYHSTSSHGPFVHVDVRGRSASWED